MALEKIWSYKFQGGCCPHTEGPPTRAHSVFLGLLHTPAHSRTQYTQWWFPPSSLLPPPSFLRRRVRAWQVHTDQHAVQGSYQPEHLHSSAGRYPKDDASQLCQPRWVVWPTVYIALVIKKVIWRVYFCVGVMTFMCTNVYVIGFRCVILC